jgi:hypothetical protein
MSTLVPLCLAISWVNQTRTSLTNSTREDLVERLSRELTKRLPYRPVRTTEGAQLKATHTTFCSPREWALLSEGLQASPHGNRTKRTWTLTVDAITPQSPCTLALLCIWRAVRGGGAATPRQYVFRWREWKMELAIQIVGESRTPMNQPVRLLATGVRVRGTTRATKPINLLHPQVPALLMPIPLLIPRSMHPTGNPRSHSCPYEWA